MISYQKSYRLKSVREGGMLLHLLAITLLLEWDLTLLAVDIAISLFVRPSVRPRFLVRSIFLLTLTNFGTYFAHRVRWVKGLQCP